MIFVVCLQCNTILCKLVWKMEGDKLNHVKVWESYANGKFIVDPYSIANCKGKGSYFEIGKSFQETL